MPVPSWLSALGHFGSDILGGIIGARLGESAGRAQLGAEIKARLEKVLVIPDREDVMKELLRLEREGAAIVRLLNRANAARGIVKVGDKYYTENFIISMLLKVEPQDREWVFSFLNGILERSEGEFFTQLEILHNDGYLQYLLVIKSVVGEKAATAITRLTGTVTLAEAAAELRRRGDLHRVRVTARRGQPIPWWKIFRRIERRFFGI